MYFYLDQLLSNKDGTIPDTMMWGERGISDS